MWKSHPVYFLLKLWILTLCEYRSQLSLLISTNNKSRLLYDQLHSNTVPMLHSNTVPMLTVFNQNFSMALTFKDPWQLKINAAMTLWLLKRKQNKTFADTGTQHGSPIDWVTQQSCYAYVYSDMSSQSQLIVNVKVFFWTPISIPLVNVYHCTTTTQSCFGFDQVSCSPGWLGTYWLA